MSVPDAPQAAVQPTTPFYTFLKRFGSLAATAYVVNGLFHLFLKTSLSATAGVIVPLVLLEEHVLINLYLAFKNRNEEDQWSLSSTEKRVLAIALVAVNIILCTSMINVFSAPVFYRALPLSWETGIKLATVNIAFDLFTTY